MRKGKPLIRGQDPAEVREKAIIRALSHPMRLKIITAASLKKGATIGEIAAMIGSTNAECHRHFKVLEQARIISYTQRHKLRQYSLNKPLMEQLKKQIKQATEKLKDGSSNTE